MNADRPEGDRRFAYMMWLFLCTRRLCGQLNINKERNHDQCY